MVQTKDLQKNNKEKKQKREPQKWKKKIKQRKRKTSKSQPDYITRDYGQFVTICNTKPKIVAESCNGSSCLE